MESVTHSACANNQVRRQIPGVDGFLSGIRCGKVLLASFFGCCRSGTPNDEVCPGDIRFSGTHEFCHVLRREVLLGEPGDECMILVWRGYPKPSQENVASSISLKDLIETMELVFWKSQEIRSEDELGDPVADGLG